MLYTVKEEYGLWYIFDKAGLRVIECGRHGTKYDALKAAHTYFYNTIDFNSTEVI